MDASQWNSVKSIFEEVIDLPPGEQRAQLDALCGSNSALRSHVEALIAADGSEDELLDWTPDQLADELFTEDTQPLPESIGPYRIEELIGRGGMGAVYKAYRETGSTHPLAVKVLHRDTNHASLVRRFKIEWQILSSLSHPNIAKLYGTVHVDKGKPFFAMEFIDGIPITSFCDAERLSLTERLQLFLKVCSATRHAHENQIIHRDIKPANVLVTPNGTPKLLDFGIAKVLNPDILDTTALLTQTGHRLLTLSYASPEQLRGLALSTSSDVYSLGVLLYELLTGQRPHDISGLSRLEAEQMICETEPPLMSEVVHDTPQLQGDLDLICRKALHKDVTRRYVSVAAFEDDINRYLENKPILARPDNLVYKVRKYAHRHKTGLSMSVAVASVLVLLTLFSSRLWSNYSETETAIIIDPGPKTLVALPFVHQGTNQQDYFAAGVVDEITSHLSTINGLQTISRTSAIKYEGINDSTDQIAEVFNADYILKGTIEFDDTDDPNGRIRVTPQLLKITDNEILWTSTFDENVSDIFNVQSLIALKIAEALNLTLLESDQLGLAKHLTDNLEAYNYFLRGNEFFKNNEDANSLRFAETMYRQATEKDTTFSKAYAELSKVHSAIWFHRIDRSDSRCQDAQHNAEKALIHNPQETESYVALGMHAYRCRNNLIQASDFFERALRVNPNTLDAIQGKAFVLRRQGKLREALSFFEQMATLDPLGADYGAIALTNQLLRHYAQADSAYQLSIKYFPEEAHIPATYARLNLAWKTPEIARETLDHDTGGTFENDFTRITSIYIDLVNENYETALNRITAMNQDIFDTQVYYIPAAHLKARALKGLDNNIEARKQETIALQLLTRYLEDHPTDSRAHATLGRVYASLGQKEKAIASGLQSLELMPIQRDAIQGPLRVEDMAAIYVMVAEYQKAIEQLRILLNNPGFVSAKLIASDPTWDALRGLPEYASLINDHPISSTH
ncbi:MAG: protein kinase [Rhodothermaceae bacterium]|nr:protein kinase [Rhodothermaceae bacterium]